MKDEEEVCSLNDECKAEFGNLAVLSKLPMGPGVVEGEVPLTVEIR